MLSIYLVLNGFNKHNGSVAERPTFKLFKTKPKVWFGAFNMPCRRTVKHLVGLFTCFERFEVIFNTIWELQILNTTAQALDFAEIRFIREVAWRTAFQGAFAGSADGILWPLDQAVQARLAWFMIGSLSFLNLWVPSVADLLSLTTWKHISIYHLVASATSLRFAYQRPLLNIFRFSVSRG